MPYRPFWKIAKMTLFNPCMKIKNHQFWKDIAYGRLPFWLFCFEKIFLYHHQWFFKLLSGILRPQNIWSSKPAKSQSPFNFIEKFDPRWLWVSVHHSYRIQFSLWPTVQGYFLFFHFSPLFFKFIDHVTSINNINVASSILLWHC